MGVARQHAGITGQVENCQTADFVAYVTARAHDLFDFCLYLPKAWCGVKERRRKAHVPEEVKFTTKPDLAAGMITGAAGAGCRSLGWPPTRSTAAAHGSGKPARKPGRGMWPRSR